VPRQSKKFRSSRILKRARCRTSCCLGPRWGTLQPAGGPSRPSTGRLRRRPPLESHAKCPAPLRAVPGGFESVTMEKELDEVCEWRPPAKGPCPGYPPVWIQPLTGVPPLRVPAPVLLPLCPSGTLLPSLPPHRSVLLTKSDPAGRRQMYCGAVAERAPSVCPRPTLRGDTIEWRLRRLEAS